MGLDPDEKLLQQEGDVAPWFPQIQLEGYRNPLRLEVCRHVVPLVVTALLMGVFLGLAWSQGQERERQRSPLVGYYQQNNTGDSHVYQNRFRMGGEESWVSSLRGVSSDPKGRE